MFSGQGVSSLRRHLNTDSAFAHLRDSTPTGHPRHRQHPVEFGHSNSPVDHGDGPADTGFDEPERDAIEDDDGLDDSEMVLDAAPPAQNNAAQGLGGVSLDASMIPPPPPPPPASGPQWPWEATHQHPQHHHALPLNTGHSTGSVSLGSATAGPHNMQLPEGMDVSTPRPSASSASASSGPDAGPSTASLHAATGGNTSGAHFHTPVELSGRAAEGPPRGSNHSTA